MGLELPFLHNADFLAMVKEDESSGPFFQTNVLHKAVLEVNDKGIEDTYVTMRLTSFHQQSILLLAILSSLSSGGVDTVILIEHVLDPSS